MNQKLKEIKEEPLFYGLSIGLLTFIFLLVLYPLVYVLSSSLSDAEAVITGQVWLFPVRPSLEGYKAVFEYRDVWVGYGNSIYYTVVGTAVNVLMTILAAYPLSRKDFVGRNGIMFLFTFTMFFSGGLIPTYLLVKDLGLMDTRGAMIIPGAIAVYQLIITRTYLMSTIPGELYEAARVDGASNTRMLLLIVLPLSGPILAVITLFYGVGHWNAFFNALIYLRDRSLRPLQIVLREILLVNSNRMLDELASLDTELLVRREYLQALLQYALIVVSILPVMVAYPFVQKHFLRGVMIGAIKG